jgi:hypothetical protein
MLKRISATTEDSQTSLYSEALESLTHLILKYVEESWCHTVIRGHCPRLLILENAEKGLCNMEGPRPPFVTEPPDPGKC